MPTRAISTTYRDDLRLFPSVYHKVALVLAAVAVVAYPFVVSSRWLLVGIAALVTVVGAVGMMILTGFTGQISLGHAAFIAIGAYVAGGLAANLGWPWWLTLPFGGLVAAAVGMAIGPFALRLRGLYLAIVTLGLLFVVEHVIDHVTDRSLASLRVQTYWWFNEPGSPSTFGTELLTLGPLEIGRAEQLYFLYIPIVLLTLWFTKNLLRSRTGRAMGAVRDRDIAASVMGIDIARVKVLAFGLSSFFAGLAGSMFTFHMRQLTIGQFDLFMSVEYIAMVILGGLGTVFGAVAGGLVFAMLGPFMEALTAGLPGIGDLTSAQRETLAFAVVVIAFLVLEPLGLYGIWLRLKIYFAAWPFKY